VREKLLKIRRTSFDEIRVRSSQALAAFAERHGWSRSAKLLSTDELLAALDDGYNPTKFREHFASRTSPRFFPAFSCSQLTVDEFRKRWPDASEELIARATRIGNGHFDLLGFQHLSFGDPIDWHLEPLAGKRSPLVHWSRIDYLDAETFGDKKIIWELNRHQFLATLGQAYWLTGDEHYVETMISHLDSWMNANPPKLGINWASSLEIAFRSISWIWALHFAKQSARLTPEILLRLLKFLYLNARHLQIFLSTYFSPNTHLTGEALGLFYIGTLFPEFREAAHWRELGLKILLEQLDRHVQSDGVYFEQSSYYHRYTTDFYLHLLILLTANDEALPQKLIEKLLLLLDHLMYITRPDGTTPLFGDDDGGRLMKLDMSAENDFRSTLAIGAALFKRGDYKFVSGEEAQEVLWLLGPEGIDEFHNVVPTKPAKQSCAFPVGGYIVMRDGWERESNYTLFDCGPHGVSNCGHAHADALALDLAANGQTVLVDPGTYTYTSSKKLRDWFRGAEAHNTVTLDGQPSSIPAGPFTWKTIAHASCSKWVSTELFDFAEASHNGFERLTEPALHHRSILFLKKNYWVVYDRIESLSAHEIAAHFHFDLGVAPLQRHGNALRLLRESSDSVVFQIAAFGENGVWNEEIGWVSHCYAQKKEAPTFSFSSLAKGAHELITFLLPEVAGAGAQPLVKEIEAIYGRAFEINIGGNHDLLMIRDFNVEGSRIETVRLASDFDFSWTRFATERSRTPEQLVLINGQALEFEGRDLLRSTKRIKYLAASRIGDRFRVETEDGVLDLTLPVADLESLFANL
jgi:heparinase II/III-like protein